MGRLCIAHDGIEPIDAFKPGKIRVATAYCQALHSALDLAAAIITLVSAGLEATLRSVAMQIEGITDAHEFRIRRIGDQLDVSCHGLMADDLPLTRALSDRLSLRKKSDAPLVSVRRRFPSARELFEKSRKRQSNST